MGWRAASRAWLSLTPEPERDLPQALATLRAQGPPSVAAVAAEHERVQELILRGTERTWLAWLHEALELAAPAPAGSPATARARAVVLDVIDNHHGLLQGLPGKAAERAADDRRRLAEILAADAAARS